MLNRIRICCFFECGDCWGSTNTIVFLSKKLGIDAYGRRGSYDSGAGATHRNAVAYINGSYYIAEAGVNEPKPRTAFIREEPLGFSLQGSTIYQYDGKNSTVRIPSVIGKTNITKLGREDGIVFVYGGVESLYIPSSIKAIGYGCMYNLVTLKTITVESNSTYFESIDNVLYPKGRESLLMCGKSKRSSLTIHNNVTLIGYGAFRECNIDKLVIPSRVKEIAQLAFYNATIGNLTIENGVELLNNAALRNINTPKIVLPDSVNNMTLATFCYANTSEVVLSKSLTAIPARCFESSFVKRVIVPDTVKTIGDTSFYNCSLLTEIYIPVSVESIGKNAFTNNYLKDIYYMGTEEQWNQIQKNCTIPSSATVHFNSVLPESSSSEPITTSSKSSSTKPITTSSSTKPVATSSKSTVEEESSTTVKMVASSLMTEPVSFLLWVVIACAIYMLL